MTLRLALLTVVAATLVPAASKSDDHWVATWGTAQLLVRTPPGGQGGRGAPAPAAATATADTPARPTPQQIGARGFSNQTVRMMVRTSLPGRRVRIGISNAFGSAPVTVSAAHIALRAKDSEIVSGSDRALTFNGKAPCVLGPGVVLFSDPVDLNIPQTGDLAVSLFFSGPTGPPTTHATALHNTYIADGDQTGKPSVSDPIVTQSYYYLSTIEVLAPSKAAVIVPYGDSITDGARSSNESNHSWPALLAVRLAAKKDTAHLGVANMGIGGNRVLRDGSGASALARLDRDVFSQAGVQWMMILEGINDIGREATVPAEAVTADELIGAFKQIIERAHTRGIKIVGCTITPYEGANYYRESGEATRQAVNTWIRTSGAFDAVADFDAATRDSANPKRLRAEFDPGDHLHPNDAGYQAMADAIDLGIFTGKRSSATMTASQH